MKIIDTHVHLGDIYGLNPNFAIEERNPSNTHDGKPNVYELMGFGNIYFGKLNYLFKSLVASSSKAITRYANLPNLLDSMQKTGIEKSIVLAIEPHVSTDCVLKACQNNQNLIPFCSIHPYDKEKKEKIKRYFEAGCKALKIHPVIQQVLPDDPATFELLEEVKSFRIPVLFHVGWGSIGKSNYGFIKNYDQLLKNFPDMTFIFAHIGFYEPLLFLDLIERHKNVSTDVSWQPPRIILKAIDRLGENRIIFGTDWPFNLQKTSLNIVLNITQGKRELRENILYKNAQEIIKIH
jgi:predicted TIM-barrel fold metal-dependent hydrolase